MKLQTIFANVIHLSFISVSLGQSFIFSPSLPDTSAINNRLRQLVKERLSEPSWQSDTNGTNGFKLSFPHATCIGRNKIFDMYALPRDKMVCMTPNVNQYGRVNPVMKAFVRKDGLETNDRMPNLFKTEQSHLFR